MRRVHNSRYTHTTRATNNLNNENVRDSTRYNAQNTPTTDFIDRHRLKKPQFEPPNPPKTDLGNMRHPAL